MQIDSNNITFNGSFKNNQEFKKIFSKNDPFNIDKELLDRFESSPSHELEIIKNEDGEATSKVRYTLFDNTTGLSTDIIFKNKDINNSLNVF